MRGAARKFVTMMSCVRRAQRRGEGDRSEREEDARVRKKRHLFVEKCVQRSSSFGSGLLSGGAQRPATETNAPVSVSPSLRFVLVGSRCGPARKSAA